jgi:hypothetical protein
MPASPCVAVPVVYARNLDNRRLGAIGDDVERNAARPIWNGLNNFGDAFALFGRDAFDLAGVAVRTFSSAEYGLHVTRRMALTICSAIGPLRVMDFCLITTPRRLR